MRMVYEEPIVDGALMIRVFLEGPKWVFEGLFSLPHGV